VAARSPDEAWAEVSRRRMLAQLGAGAALGAAASFAGAAEDEAPAGPRPAVLNVRDFGAAGDGKADDTKAFQRAMDAAGRAGGDLVFVPRGRYRIEGRLSVPKDVVLEGVFRAPQARTQNRGSCLLAYAGRGKPDAKPFLTLGENGTLHGLTIYYPEQTSAKDPAPYPWTVRQVADNASIVDVLIVNPWQAVDCGTVVGGRHYIRGLYAQPLHRGLLIDNCYDVGRVQDVHFWPFWHGGRDAMTFLQKSAVAFEIGRTDWQYMQNCFCIWYRVGFRFFAGEKGGPGNVLVTNSGSDIGPTAVRVEAVQGHSGVSFVNGQFMSGIEVEETNTGPLKFTNCGFWPSGKIDSHAVLKGRGHTTFLGCHFTSWDARRTGAPAIDAVRGGLTVSGCDFVDAGRRQVRIGKGVEAAVVTGNRCRGGIRIANELGDSPRVAIAHNVDDSRREEAGAIVVPHTAGGGGFVTTGKWQASSSGLDYAGTTRWAARGKGECTATWRPDLPRAGRYAVHVWRGGDPSHDHATNAPFTVRHRGGEATVRVNQREGAGQWHLLGTYEFAKGRSGCVTLSNAADGNVAADAVKFVPAQAEG
jgi:hypothetical protein